MHASEVLPRVTVITIFLNAERFIEESIQSVFSQTYTDWEYLLVDDGSTDGSSAIARRYATDHPDRVRYLEHPGHANLGMSASRNLGIAEARGEYVALLDADDLYLPSKLEEQVAILDSKPEAAMLYGRTLFWNGWTGRPDDVARDFLTTPAPQLDTLIEAPYPLIDWLNHHAYFPCTCSVLIRRDVLLEVGGFEDQFRGTFEDMALYAKIFLDYPVFVVDRCWDWYRQHEGSSWAAAMRTQQYVHQGFSPTRYELLRWLARYLRQRNCATSQVGRIVHRKLLAYQMKKLGHALRQHGTRLRPFRARDAG